MNARLGVVGSSCMDIFAVSKFFKPQLNERAQQIILEHGSQLWLDNAIHEPGGGGLLAALVFARQGNATDLLTKTGSDLFAQILQKVLVDEGITVLGHEAPQHHTDTTLHLTSEGHDQTVLHYNASYLSLSVSDCDVLSPDLEWLHIASLPAEKSVLVHLLKHAAKNAIPVSINPRFVHTLPTKVLLKILRKCTIVVINRDEASVLLGSYCSASQAAEKLSDQGLNHVVVYDGLEGTTVISQSIEYSAGSYRKTKPLETSGAEEVFAAAYAAKFARSQNVEKAITHASAQACSVLTVAGARAGILQKPVLEPMQIEVQMKGQK